MGWLEALRGELAFRRLRLVRASKLTGERERKTKIQRALLDKKQEKKAILCEKVV